MLFTKDAAATSRFQYKKAHDFPSTPIPERTSIRYQASAERASEADTTKWLSVLSLCRAFSAIDFTHHFRSCYRVSIGGYTPPITYRPRARTRQHYYGPSSIIHTHRSFAVNTSIQIDRAKTIYTGVLFWSIIPHWIHFTPLYDGPKWFTLPESL